MRAELEVQLADPSPPGVATSLLQEVHAMQRLVDDLLVLAQGDESGATATRVVDLDDVVLDEIRALLRGGVVVDAAHVSGAQVIGVPDQLRRAVRNLLDNALRHAYSAVHVGLAESGGFVTLRVDDDGGGVPADRRTEIFERFNRVDQSRRTGTGGTGLGLAIVRDVVERHGGTVELDPEHQPGARFVVTLPAAAESS